MTTQPNPIIGEGIPLRDRTAEQIRTSLAGKASPEDIEQFVKLQAYAASEGIGVTQVAHRTAIASGILSPCYNGRYNGDYAAIAERIAAFFYRLDQKDLYGGIREFVETGLARALWTVFDKLRIVRRIHFVRGPEQTGKTIAAKEYEHRNNNGRTFYVQVPGGSKTGFGDFVWELARALDIPYSIKLREKKIRIKERLVACDLLIVDEAHLIDSWTDQSQAEFWDYLRTELYNNGERGIVLLTTNCDMLAVLQSWRKRFGYNVGQLIGRMRNEVTEIDPAEDIVSADVELLVSRYYRPGKEVVSKLHDLATRPQMGHFGLLSDILNEAWTEAKAANRNLTDEIVLRVARRVLKTLESRADLYAV